MNGEMENEMAVEMAFGPIVSAEQLAELIEDGGVRVLDTRSLGEYAAAHLPGAIQTDAHALRLPDSSETALARFVHEAITEFRRCGVRRGERIVFYEGFSGTNAARAVWMLDLLGIGGGAMLDGGMQAWAEAGGSFSNEICTAEPSEIEAAMDRSVLATAEELVALENLRVLDTRADLEYMTGTIPTSIHLEWLTHLTPDGRFRPLDELRELYAELGFDSTGDEAIATFCGSGYRAAHSYVVLKALGFPAVKNYAPSWGEWGRRPDLPVERPGRR